MLLYYSILNLFNFLQKAIKCSASLTFYGFSSTRLINSIKHEQSCKILIFNAVNSEIFARILFSRMTLKDEFSMLKLATGA